MNIPPRYTRATGLFLALGFALPAFCAEGERRRMIESLFRYVIESRIDNDLQGKTPSHHPRHVPTPGQPGPVPHPGTTKGMKGQGGPVDPRMTAYRGNIGRFAHHSSTLATALAGHADVQGARPLIPRALKLKSSSEVLLSRCQHSYDFDNFVSQYGLLDSEWRNLSYELRTLNGLDAGTRASMAELDRLSAEMCQLCGIAPQFDRNAVLRSLYMQAAYLDSLLDAVDFELQHEKDCQNILSRGRRLKDQLLRLEPVVLNDPYDQVVSKYSQYSGECRKYCATLYPLRKRAIERCLARVRAGSDSVFQQLWVEPTIDRAYLGYLSDTMVFQLTSLFDEMSVSTLVTLPPRDQQAILVAGNQLLGQCRSYCGSIRENAALRDLVRDYYGIDKGWTQLRGHFGQVSAGGVVNTTRSIDGYCGEIREILGVHSLYDRESALSLAASLEDLAEHLYSLSARYGRYCRSTALRNKLNQNGNDFFTRSGALHQQIAREAPFPEIQEQCNKLLSTWEVYGPDLDSMPRYGLSPTRHQYILALRQDINPVIAELAMMFVE